MKKLIALLMAAVMFTALLSGCGSKKSDVYKVGVIQITQHEALDAATAGFKAALTEKLGDNVQIDVKNAANEPATCATIANQLVSDGYDLIMANATPSLQAAVAATATIPIVATSITDYATALDADDWNGKTGINVTGTSDLAPLEEQAKMIKELVPDAKTVGILYCSAEANSKYQATEMSKYLKDLGFESKEFTCSDSNDVAAVTTSACQESDVIFIPTDNTMASSAEIVDGVASQAGIPIVAGEEGICKKCGIATLSIDYYSIGYSAGEMAYEILKNGKDPGDMEIGFATDLTKKYMADRCTTLNITIPDGYTAIENAD